MDDQVPNVRSDCAWVAAAPLGWPVVPEVKMRSERSSGCTAAARAALVAGSTASPAARNASSPVNGTAATEVGRLTVVAQEQHAGQVAGVMAVEHGRVVGAQEAPHRHQGRGAGVADDVRRLSALEPGVQRDEHGAGAQQAEGGQHPLGTVGRPHGGPVPGADAGGHEAAGVAIDLLGQLGVGQPQLAVDQRLQLSVSPRRVLDQVGHGAPDAVGPRILLLGRRAADSAAHGCWLLTEMTSPER